MADDRDPTKKERTDGGNGEARKSAEKPRSLHPAVYSTLIGLYAGFIWGLIRWLVVALKFTDVPQAFLADPWVRRAALGHWYWQWGGLLLFMLMSALAGFVYWLLLRALRGPWPGIVYGAAWWAALFFAVGPMSGATLPAREIGWKSLISELCIYVAWGLFIGYSIAFEYHDEAGREPDEKGNPQSGREPSFS